MTLVIWTLFGFNIGTRIRCDDCDAVTPRRQLLRHRHERDLDGLGNERHVEQHLASRGRVKCRQEQKKEK